MPYVPCRSVFEDQVLDVGVLARVEPDQASEALLLLGTSSLGRRCLGVWVGLDGSGLHWDLGLRTVNVVPVLDLETDLGP